MPVSSKDCAHGSFSPFADQKLSGWLTRWKSGVFSGFLADPMVLLCCNALQVLCRDEDALGAPEQSCSYYTGFFFEPLSVDSLSSDYGLFHCCSCKGRVRYTSVKNVNPRTPLVYPNRRFRKITTPDANTYCGCGPAVTYFSAMSNKGTCSTLTPKCTSDSFFSLQTPHTTEQVNRNQGRHTATRPRGQEDVPVWLQFHMP